MDKRQIAQQAIEDTITKVHAYMRAHPHSELHRQGKMFGILLCEHTDGQPECLRAFSAMLDGSYFHDGFVPPVYAMTQPPIGSSPEESKRLQQLLFAQYRFTNIHGETRNLLDIFSQEKPIVSIEEWFGDRRSVIRNTDKLTLPPAGTGECCAPKLLQYALSHGLRPLILAEFWIGASPRTELRREGVYYPPCSGKCMPILHFMLQGTELEILSSDAPYTRSDINEIDILFEDETLMAVNKPAGMLSVPGKNGDISLTEHLLSQHPGVLLQPAHRLDQDTSGILILAKTSEAYKHLQSYFQRRDILKRYEALIVPNGNWQKAEEGTISLPLLPNPYDRPRQMIELIHGRPAITTYRLREHRPDGTIFVDFYPQTGRTHQLRVHAAHPDGLNAPIKGDRLYGTPSDRLYLHAAEIRFTHPVTKEEMHFCIPSRF